MNRISHTDNFIAKDGQHYRLDGVLYEPGQEPKVSWHSFTLINARATLTGFGEGTASDWLKMKETM